MESKARLTALGAYVPPRVLTNDDLSRMVETSDEWIVQRTGIRERRIADEGVYASDLGARAVENLRERSGKSLDDVDLLICTTFTADYCTPSTAAVIHGKVGLPRAIATFDLNAACAGFSQGLLAANAYITAGELILDVALLRSLDDYVADEMSHRAMYLINRDESRHIAIDYRMVEYYASPEYAAIRMVSLSRLWARPRAHR